MQNRCKYMKTDDSKGVNFKVTYNPFYNNKCIFYYLKAHAFR